MRENRGAFDRPYSPDFAAEILLDLTASENYCASMIPNWASFWNQSWSVFPGTIARRHCLTVLLLCCLADATIADEFYRTFLNSFDTNYPGAIGIRSPQLVDTNNIQPKLTNTVVSLSNAVAQSEIASIRLGMTMEGVVSKWGKPKFIWSKCWGGPRLGYADADVIFEPGSNGVMRIIMHKLPRLDVDLSKGSSIDDCIRVLGQPTLRAAAHEGSSFSSLHYLTPSRCRLVMNFVDGSLYKIFLEQPDLRLPPKK